MYCQRYKLYRFERKDELSKLGNDVKGSDLDVFLLFHKSLEIYGKSQRYLSGLAISGSRFENRASVMWSVCSSLYPHLPAGNILVFISAVTFQIIPS
jgi:hypothetical protein